MKETFMAIFRQVVTALMTYLSTKGFIDGNEVEAIVTGLIAIASAAWAAYAKYKDTKAKKALVAELVVANSTAFNE